MNRYVVRGVLGDAAAGKCVVVFSGTGRERRFAFDQVAAEAATSGSVKRVLRANGSERIDMLSGGRGVFLAATDHGQRGYSADVVVLDGPMAAERAGVHPAIMVAASPCGEVVRA